ncbi:MAG: hypothetical protein R6V08_00395 [Desulfuromonadales bacterium]
MLQLFNAFGEIKEIFTLVDFYTYIKAVEYLICVAFFSTFPLFFKYITSEKG